MEHCRGSQHSSRMQCATGSCCKSMVEATTMSCHGATWGVTRFLQLSCVFHWLYYGSWPSYLHSQGSFFKPTSNWRRPLGDFYNGLSFIAKKDPELLIVHWSEIVQPPISQQPKRAEKLFQAPLIFRVGKSDAVCQRSRNLRLCTVAGNDHMLPMPRINSWWREWIWVKTVKDDRKVLGVSQGFQSFGEGNHSTSGGTSISTLDPGLFV